MITSNIGGKDLEIGDPQDPSVRKRFFDPAPPELTEGLGFKFKKQPFFRYSVRNDDTSIKVSGYKEAFCFDGLDPECCHTQGLAAGGKKTDTYRVDMACQFVIIDGIPDGKYILEATVNARSVEAVKNYSKDIFIGEDNYDNNTVAVRLKIKGDKFTESYTEEGKNPEKSKEQILLTTGTVPAIYDDGTHYVSTHPLALEIPNIMISFFRNKLRGEKNSNYIVFEISELNSYVTR